eukprot:XP_014063812.1 PREDICTED: uncharacterized protein LOC106609472 [Salmo salar]
MQSHTKDGSRSPSSWISDSSPSDIISGSTSSQCESCCDGEESEGSDQTSQALTSLNDMGPSPDQGVPVKEEPGCPDRGERGWPSTGGRRRPGMLECIMREKERKREERKTKVLNIYSRLQDSGPLQPSRNRSRSRFEDSAVPVPAGGADRGRCGPAGLYQRRAAPGGAKGRGHPTRTRGSHQTGAPTHQLPGPGGLPGVPAPLRPNPQLGHRQPTG